MNIFQPIVSFLRWAVHELSKADGREGLTASDIETVLGWVRAAASMRKQDGAPVAGLLKNEEVAAKIVSGFGGKVHPAIARIIAWAVYLIAQRKGLK